MTGIRVNERMDGSKIGRFIFKRIVEAKNNARIFPDGLTELEYYCDTDSGFGILSDQKTIFGVQYAGKCNLICSEDILDDKPQILTFPRGVKYKGKHEYKGKMTEEEKRKERERPQSFSNQYVRTLIICEERDSLMAGEDDGERGRVVEYNLSTGEMVKDYGSLSISKVRCGRRIENLCFFGGIRGEVKIIDTDKQEIMIERITTSIEHIYSMTFCAIIDPEEKVYLALCGRYPDYEHQKTDVFDISECYRKKLKSGEEKKSEKKAKIFLEMETSKQKNDRAKKQLLSEKNKEIARLEEYIQHLERELEESSKKEETSKSNENVEAPRKIKDGWEITEESEKEAGDDPAEANRRLEERLKKVEKKLKKKKKREEEMNARVDQMEAEKKEAEKQKEKYKQKLNKYKHKCKQVEQSQKSCIKW